jgi:hypothetical protein
LHGLKTPWLYVERLTNSLRKEKIGTAAEYEKWTRHRSSLEESNGSE